MALPFVAQLAEVEVDTRTGEVRVLRVVAAQDSGRVMNELTFRNQVTVLDPATMASVEGGRLRAGHGGRSPMPASPR